eukprot:scaffold55662_cov53-Attheya_sp.AAC.5
MEGLSQIHAWHKKVMNGWRTQYCTASSIVRHPKNHRPKSEPVGWVGCLSPVCIISSQPTILLGERLNLRFWGFRLMTY